MGSEYIIMEEATGTHLGRSWDEMSPDSKLKIMREVVSIEAKMLSVSFSQYVFLLFPAAYELTLIQPLAMEASTLRVTQ